MVPLDSEYVQRLFPTAGPSFFAPLHHGDSLFTLLKAGHRNHAGQFIAVERTQKPGYLPGNQQFYGTAYGFASTADPLVGYMGRAGFTTRTRVSICAPAVFNLVGTVFHPEWSNTASLELGFYRESHGNAQCFAVGPNGPGDFSFVHQVETESEWPLLGFRLALMPGSPAEVSPTIGQV